MAVTLLALGGLPVWALIGSGAALAIASWFLLDEADARVAPWATWTLLGLSLYSIVQAVPLPIGFVEVLSPTTAHIASRVGTLLETPSRWTPLSLDPSASLLEAFKFASYTLLFILAFKAGAHGSKRNVFATVFGSGVLLTLISIIHAATSATKVYGLYRPTFDATSRQLGPLLNQNHLAGYLILAGFCGLGLPRSTDWSSRVFRLLGVTWLFSCVVLTGSRAGVVALLLGLLLYAVLRPTRSHSRDKTTFLGLVVLAMLVIAFTSSARLWDELFGRDAEKILLFKDSVRIITDFPLTGIGRGAFASVSSAYHTIPDNVVFTHAENLPLQWVTEWGLPVSIAAAIALFIAFNPRRLLRSKSTSNPAIVAGTSALLAQNFFDFSSEIPAVAVAWIAVAAAAHGAVREEPSRTNFPRFLSRRYGALAAVAVIPVVLALTGGLQSLQELRVELGQKTTDTLDGNSTDVERLRQELSRAQRRHPADYYFARLRGLLDAHDTSESALPWIGYSLERCLHCGRTHLLLAGVLARLNPQQAMLHLRKAVENDNTLPAEAAALALRITSDTRWLTTSIPEAPKGATYALELAARHPEVSGRVALLEVAAARLPDDTSTQVRLLNALFDARSERIFNDKLRTRISQLRGRVQLAPWALLFEILLGSDPAAERMTRLEALCRRYPQLEPRCSRDIVRLAATLDLRSLEHASTLAEEHACPSSCECAETLEAIAAVHSQRRESARAATSFFRAAESCPTGARFEQAARTAEAAGMLPLALQAYRESVRLTPNERVERDIARLRTSMLHEVPPSSGRSAGP